MFPLGRCPVSGLFRLQTGIQRLRQSPISSALVRSISSRRSIVTFSGRPYNRPLCQPTAKKVNWHPVRRLYLDPNTHQMVYDPIMIMVCGASILYFAVKSFFIERNFNKNHLFKNSNGEPVTMEKKLLEELYTILEESNIEGVYKTMDLAQFTFANKLEPVVDGTFHSRFGVFIGLPFYLNYSVEVDDRQADFDVFLRHFGLDKEQLTDCNDDGKSVLEQLQDCLELSSQARRFILLSSLYAASTPVDPFLNTAALAMVPFAGYSLYRRQFKRPNSVALNVFVFSGYLMACASIYVMKFLQQRYGSWATFSFECEGEDSDTARAELRKGATEYLQKLSKLQEIVDKYSTSAQKQSLWSDYQVYTAKRRLADLDVFSKKDCPITSILL